MELFGKEKLLHRSILKFETINYLII